MKKILSSPIWTSIGAIAAILALILTYKQFIDNTSSNKIKIERKLNEFYKPLDILLTSSYNEWRYLNKNNKTASFWDVYSFKKSDLNVSLKYNTNYRLKLDSPIEFSVENGLILLYGSIKILDKKNNVLGTGLYTKLLWYKEEFLFEESKKEQEQIYKIKIFLPYLKLNSIVSNSKTKSIQVPKYPSIIFYLRAPNNVIIGNKEIIDSIVKFYSSKFLNTKYLSQLNFQLQAENKNEFIISNITKEKRDKWIKYMLNIFKPYHEKLEKLIYEKQYLVEDKKMKQLLERLLFHINGYKIVFKQWEEGDYSQLTSVINFPSEINQYTKEKIITLEKLLHSE